MYVRLIITCCALGILGGPRGGNDPPESNVVFTFEIILISVLDIVVVVVNIG